MIYDLSCMTYDVQWLMNNVKSMMANVCCMKEDGRWLIDTGDTDDDLCLWFSVVGSDDLRGDVGIAKRFASADEVEETVILEFSAL